MSGTDYTTTPNLALFKPISNRAIGTWGDLWNSNADTLDATMAHLSGGPFLPLVGGTITPGSLNIMPPTRTPAAPFAPLFHTSSSFTGTVTPPADGTHAAVHLWEITNDNASYGHSGQTGFRLVHTYGGPGFDGGRTGMTVRLTQVAGATGTVPQASNQQRIAFDAEVYACDNAAGTDSTDYTKVAGGIYSINTYTRMYGPGTVAGAGGATNFLDCLGMNMEMLMETGTSVANKSMILFTLDAGDHVQGSIVDACLNFANGGGDSAIVGWQNLLATGRPDGKWPMNWTGNLWGTYHGSAPYRMQVAYGLNWGDIYFTSGAIKSPGFLLDGNGNINTGALCIATAGQTTTLDTKLIYVVSATVVPGSSIGAWGPTMGMYDNLGNQWIPNTLGGTGGTQLLSVTLVSPAYITGPGPTTATVISQSGPAAQAQLNLVWSTSPGALNIQPSGGATEIIGPLAVDGAVSGAGITSLLAPYATTAALAGYLSLSAGGTVNGATTFTAASLPMTLTGNTVVPSPLGGNTYLQITGANGTTPRISLDAFGAVATIVYRTAGGTAAAPSKITGGGPLGTLGFTGHDGVAYSVASQAQVAVWSDGAAGWSATNHPTKFTWAVTPVNSTTMAEVMRLSSTGNLSIGSGTDNTIDKLQVTGSARMSSGLGVFGHVAPTVQPAFTGAKGSNAALASVIAVLVAAGFATDSTTA